MFRLFKCVHASIKVCAWQWNFKGRNLDSLPLMMTLYLYVAQLWKCQSTCRYNVHVHMYNRDTLNAKLRQVLIMMQSLAFLCNMWHCKHEMLPQMQCKDRIWFFLCVSYVALHLTNQFSEFYHNAMDAVQGFVLLYEPSLSLQERTKWTDGSKLLICCRPYLIHALVLYMYMYMSTHTYTHAHVHV